MRRGTLPSLSAHPWNKCLLGPLTLTSQLSQTTRSLTPPGTTTQTEPERAKSFPCCKKCACAVAVGCSAGGGVGAEGGVLVQVLRPAGCTQLAGALRKLGEPFLPRPLPAVLQLSALRSLFLPLCIVPPGWGGLTRCASSSTPECPACCTARTWWRGCPDAPRGPSLRSTRFLKNCLNDRP